jgi:hypothetical protein
MNPNDNALPKMDCGDNDVLWNTLQEPARPGYSSAAYLLLLAALDTGWRILEPVYFSACPGCTRNPVYHILLHKAPSFSIHPMMIPTIPELEIFLKDEGVEIFERDIAIPQSYPLYLS